jgi:hypothetical protein
MSGGVARGCGNTRGTNAASGLETDGGTVEGAAAAEGADAGGADAGDDGSSHDFANADHGESPTVWPGTRVGRPVRPIGVTGDGSSRVEPHVPHFVSAANTVA